MDPVVPATINGTPFLVKAEFVWAYRNTFTEISNIPAGTGHPPVSVWKNGRFEPFTIDIIIPVGLPPAPTPSLGWAINEDELIQMCTTLSQYCLPRPGGAPGKNKSPKRIELKVGDWFILKGYPETMKIIFSGPWGDGDKPYWAEINIGCLPSSEADKETSGAKWDVNNTWDFKSMT